MGLTTDPNDPRLGHGVDEQPVDQNEMYLVLSEEERAKGFVRPVRNTYKHVGPPGPRFPLRDPTDREREQGYTKYEDYPESERPLVGRGWRQADLDTVNNGCGMTTSMGQVLSETYARDPKFYGSTYCLHCRKHLPVQDFVWVENGQATDQRVGS